MTTPVPALDIEEPKRQSETADSNRNQKKASWSAVKSLSGQLERAFLTHMLRPDHMHSKSGEFGGAGPIRVANPAMLVV